MKIAVIGNCQAMQLAEILSLKIPNANILKVHANDIVKEDKSKLLENVKTSDYVFSNPLIGERYGKFEKGKLEKSINVKIFPTIVFTGYHPDCLYLNGGGLKSPIGDYHSAIAALAFKAKLTVEDTCKIYNTKIFKELGYYDFFEDGISDLLNSLMGFNILCAESFECLFRENKMMHTINHPKIELLDIISTFLLTDSGIEFIDFQSSEFMVDNFPNSSIFPLYPGIAELINQKGNFVFKADNNVALKTGCKILHLEQFIEHSFKIYKNVGIHELSNPRFTEEYQRKAEEVFTNYLGVKDNTNSRPYKVRQNTSVWKKAVSSVGVFTNYFNAKNKTQSHPSHPYKIRESYSFWKKAISSVPVNEVDPVVKSTLNITKDEKIATAGSCFAQHIAKRLAKSGFNYYVAEKAPESMSSIEAIQENYGVFSARYGNLYTTRQLLQLFDRAFGNLKPSLKAWRRPDGKYVDPFRPQISERGYNTRVEVLSDQKKHLELVRSMFEELDVFVFTLGLTEAWVNIEDASVLPIAPGVVAGEFDQNKYKFINFTKDEVASDMNTFLAKLSQVNKKAKVLLTVSPVPLMATYEDRHVLVSTTLSKSILRVVAEEISTEHENVTYFPSYEIITGNFNKGSYFKDDLRDVTPDGVDHVMRLFMKHCTNETFSASDENKGLSEIVCDEEALDI